MENRIIIRIRNERGRKIPAFIAGFYDNTKDDHSYTKGRQPPQRLQPRLRQLPGDFPGTVFSFARQCQKGMLTR